MSTENRKTIRLDPGKLEPHPFAEELPPLTPDEYAGLKDDIVDNGILYPPFVDEDDKILDGVHRVSVAVLQGLGPISVVRVTGLSDERKREIAYGANLRRRHLDREARERIARKLHEEGKSVREIAALTGFSKSAIGRDIRPPMEATPEAAPVTPVTPIRPVTHVVAAPPTVPNGTPESEEAEEATDTARGVPVLAQNPLTEPEQPDDAAPQTDDDGQPETEKWLTTCPSCGFDFEVLDALAEEAS